MKRQKLIEEDWEARTAAFLLLKGHPLSYFFSLSETEKIFAHAAIRVYQEEEMERFKAQLSILAAGRGMKIHGQS